MAVIEWLECGGVLARVGGFAFARRIEVTERKGNVNVFIVFIFTALVEARR